MFTGRATPLGGKRQTGFARSGATTVRRIFEPLAFRFRGALSLDRIYLFTPFLLSPLFSYDQNCGLGVAKRFHFRATKPFTPLAHYPFVH
jgi:hypothetical protein